MKGCTQFVETPTTPAGTAPAPKRSRLSRDQRLALRAMAAPDDERERYVADLARRVQDRTYDRSGQEIAEAIIEHRLADEGA